MELALQEILIRLGVSALLGCAIGIERERLNWVAGMRTHMLVCVGSTLIMMVSMFGFSDVLGNRSVVLDPSRVAAQVVSGIGFLGAGTIFFWKKEIIRGLTTAAALWAVAGIGLAIGGGMYTAGIATTVLVLVILALMKPVEKMIFKKEEKLRHSLYIKVNQEKMTLRELQNQIESEGVKLMEMNVVKSQEPIHADKVLLEVYLIGEGTRLLDLADKLKGHPAIQSVTYT